MNTTKKLKTIFSKKNIVKLFAYIGVFAVVIATSFIIGKNSVPKVVSTSDTKSEMVDVRVLKAQLKESSELTTAKLTLSGAFKYNGEGIPGLTKEGFFIVYDADIRAGIDLSDVEIPEDKIDNVDKKIYITIPKAKLQGTPTIDANKISIYAKDFVIFPNKTEEQTVKAIALAQEKAKEQAEQSGIIQLADKQSEALVVGLLSKVVPSGYSIEVIKENNNAKE